MHTAYLLDPLASPLLPQTRSSLAGPGGDISKDLNSRVVQAERLRLAVVALTNLNSKSKEAMDALCEEDRLIHEMDGAGHCGLVPLYGVHVSPVAFHLRLGNEPRLTP